MIGIEENNQAAERYRTRAGDERRAHFELAIKVNDNLLLIGSAVVAILLSLSDYAELRYIVLVFVLSIFTSVSSLFIQKEMHRAHALNLLIAADNADKAKSLWKGLSVTDHSHMTKLRNKIKWVNRLLNLSILLFVFGFVLVLIHIWGA